FSKFSYVTWILKINQHPQELLKYTEWLDVEPGKGPPHGSYIAGSEGTLVSWTTHRTPQTGDIIAPSVKAGLNGFL
ncbi:hypothetical protein J6590_099922, partial [Homalodisca vitripennis]